MSASVVTVDSDDTPDVVIFFIKLGLEMPKVRIDQLAKTAVEKGAMVVRDFEAPPSQEELQKNRKTRKRHRQLEGLPRPTHLVVDDAVKADRVAKLLKFKSVEAFEQYLRAHGMQCALPIWIIQTTGMLRAQLGRDQRWWKVDLFGSNKASSKATAKKPQSLEEAGNPGSDNEEEERGKNRRFPQNMMIADQLRIMAKLHQKAPIDRLRDPWKSYSLDKTAGRIQNLDFEVNTDTLKLVEKINGIGKSTLGKIEEILSTGTLERITVFQTLDKDRVAMREMMAIWGAGSKKATDLVKQGYRTIEDVRRGLENQELKLERNQKIGVQCFEDFREQMTRNEAEAIGNIIEQAIRRRFGRSEDKLEITIMGSYRRGKKECGDVDLIITHKDYVKTVPPLVLGEVVEVLLDEGHMAFHLTFIAGMKVRRKGDTKEGGYNYSDDNPPKPKPGKESGSSYMGVFHSPTVPGKRRRVDIKFYPHRERAFAWIHFTGCGFFNRSIRLYADVKHNLQLSDHGIFKRGVGGEKGKRLLEDASTEKDVFDFLGLEYKDPHERDCHDAVVYDDGLDEATGQKLINRDFEKFARGDCKWIE
ncbi:DNA polymerase lambda [Seminavis robusta]|uniref:DNA polymerase n=1 Tax=Seminavis robusta TaxID=568900 RepID=A0A9N8E9K0_9STRA|nr:DNA polymerase lambda [Seminavis robusta]|eukprot:Sro774_g200710.1 DNA polymerase lambda (588) ;mRNA; r:41274-43469